MDVLESARQAAAVLDGNLGGDQLPSDDVSVHPAQPTPGTMTIATWNVWFDGFARFTRWAVRVRPSFLVNSRIYCWDHHHGRQHADDSQLQYLLSMVAPI